MKNKKGHSIRKVNNGFVYLVSNPNNKGRIVNVGNRGERVLVNFGYNEYHGYIIEKWFNWREVMADRFR